LPPTRSSSSPRATAPYCVKAAQLLDNLGVTYTKLEVDNEGIDDDTINVINTHAKVKTYPKVYIGLECIGGCDALHAIAKSGVLQQKLTAAGISYDQ
jgi:glutaredoxin 3